MPLPPSFFTRRLSLILLALRVSHTLLCLTLPSFLFCPTSFSFSVAVIPRIHLFSTHLFISYIYTYCCKLLFRRRTKTLVHQRPCVMRPGWLSEACDFETRFINKLCGPYELTHPSTPCPFRHPRKALFFNSMTTTWSLSPPFVLQSQKWVICMIIVSNNWCRELCVGQKGRV